MHWVNLDNGVLTREEFIWTLQGLFSPVANWFPSELQTDGKGNQQLDLKYQESYLKELVALLQCQLPEGSLTNKDTEGEQVDKIIEAAVADRRLTPKVQSLITLLLNYQDNGDFRAIIFVERVVAALVLPKVLLEIPSLGSFKCASLVRNNDNQEMHARQMQDTIAKFCDGQVNLLVATSVAEGLDIRECNVILNFDLAKTFLAYIRSKGHARKVGSKYILMLERGNAVQESFLGNANRSEETLKKEIIKRYDLNLHKDSSKLASVGRIPSMSRVASFGAAAVALVHFYCARYSLHTKFYMEAYERPDDGPTEYSCELCLPADAPFKKLKGPVCGSVQLAKEEVCLDACNKLQEMGAFYEMVPPGNREEGLDRVPARVATMTHAIEDLAERWITTFKSGQLRKKRNRILLKLRPLKKSSCLSRSGPEKYHSRHYWDYL